MQSAYALRICIADTDRGSVRMEMYTYIDELFAEPKIKLQSIILKDPAFYFSATYRVMVQYVWHRINLISLIFIVSLCLQPIMKEISEEH